MPKLSDSKLEGGISDGPQIRTLFNDDNFIVHVTDDEKAVWTNFRKVCQNFLGNKKSQDYEKLVSDMIEKKTPKGTACYVYVVVPRFGRM